MASRSTNEQTPFPLPRHILLTGATGYVGSYLTAVLAAAGSTCWCVVRARSDTAAATRLRDAVQRWDPPPGTSARVRAIRGDVDAPHLGIAAAEYARHTRTV